MRSRSAHLILPATFTKEIVAERKVDGTEDKERDGQECDWAFGPAHLGPGERVFTSEALRRRERQHDDRRHESHAFFRKSSLIGNNNNNIISTNTHIGRDTPTKRTQAWPNHTALNAAQWAGAPEQARVLVCCHLCCHSLHAMRLALARARGAARRHPPLSRPRLLAARGRVASQGRVLPSRPIRHPRPLPLDNAREPGRV